MGEYIILYREDTPANLLLTSTRVNGRLTKKSFATLEEAVEFAKTLSFNVVIYKGVAVSRIKHDIEVYEDE